MAYNPALYMPYQQVYQPNVVQPVSQPVNGLVSVTGLEGAKAYQLPPNSAMPLFDAGSDILYVKTTDAAGYPTLKTFRFEPMDAIEVQPVQTGVTREEFDALLAKVEELAKPKSKRKADDGE